MAGPRLTEDAAPLNQCVADNCGIGPVVAGKAGQSFGNFSSGNFRKHGG